MNRRMIAAGCCLLFPACTAGDAPAAAVKDFHVIEGGFARGQGPDGNTYIYDAPDGLVVIDTGRHPGHSALILDYARSRGKPVATIVNTHWHLDHTTGNRDILAVFPEARVIATDAIEAALTGFLARGAAESEAMLAGSADLPAADRAELERGIAAVRDPGALLPDVVVADSARLRVDGRTLELFVAERAVTAADIWIWDPATKTAIIGDLLTVPAPFFDTACPEGWRAALDAVEEKPFERVAAGHGALLSRADYFVWHKAFDGLLDCARNDDGAQCADGWLEDAATFIAEKDQGLARAMAVYYVDEIIRSPVKTAEFCGPGKAPD